MVNFVAAVAYHFCLALPAAFTQPGDPRLADPLMYPGTTKLQYPMESLWSVKTPNGQIQQLLTNYPVSSGVRYVSGSGDSRGKRRESTDGRCPKGDSLGDLTNG